MTMEVQWKQHTNATIAATAPLALQMSSHCVQHIKLDLVWKSLKVIIYYHERSTESVERSTPPGEWVAPLYTQYSRHQ